MNFSGRVKNTLPSKFITLDFASLSIFVQKLYKVENIYSVTLKASHHYYSISDLAVSAYTFEDQPLIRELEPGIQYVNLSNIKTTDVDQVIARLRNARGLVLDLRNYPADFMGWWNFLSHFATSNISSLPMYDHIPAAPNRERTKVVTFRQEIEPTTPKQIAYQGYFRIKCFHFRHRLFAVGWPADPVKNTPASSRFRYCARGSELLALLESVEKGLPIKNNF